MATEVYEIVYSFQKSLQKISISYVKLYGSENYLYKEYLYEDK